MTVVIVFDLTEKSHKLTLNHLLLKMQRQTIMFVCLVAKYLTNYGENFGKLAKINHWMYD